MEILKKEFDKFRASIDSMEYLCVLMDELIKNVDKTNKVDVEELRDFMYMIFSKYTIHEFRLEQLYTDVNNMYSQSNVNIKSIDIGKFEEISKRIIKVLKNNN